MIKHLLNLASGNQGSQEAGIKGIAKELGLEGFSEGLLDTVLPGVEKEDQGRYKNIRQEIRIENTQFTLYSGDMIVVRYLNNAQVLVKAGAKLDVINLTNSTISFEEGGVVKVYSSDGKSIIKETIPDRSPKKCVNCGAPFEGRSVCSYCKSENSFA